MREVINMDDKEILYLNCSKIKCFSRILRQAADFLFSGLFLGVSITTLEVLFTLSCSNFSVDANASIAVFLPKVLIIFRKNDFSLSIIEIFLLFASSVFCTAFKCWLLQNYFNGKICILAKK